MDNEELLEEIEELKEQIEILEDENTNLENNNDDLKYDNEKLESKNEKLVQENAELKARLEKSVELPCKVGDKVYTTKCGYIREVKVRTFFIGNPSYNRGEASQSVEMVRTTEFDIPFKNFGKTVFLTREEAEQALKGSADDE